MGQIACRPQTAVSIFTNQITSCQFEEAQGFAQIFNGTATYATVFYAVSLALILLLWLFTACIRYKDFSRCFVLSNLVPLTLWHIFSILYLVNNSYLYLGDTLTTVFGYAADVFGMTFSMNLLFTLFFFLLQNLWTARKRVLSKRTGFYIVCPLFWFLIYTICRLIPQIFQNQVFTVSIYIMHGLLFLIGVIKIAMLIALCCCSSPRIGQSSAPAVSNARSRMGWSILLSIFVLLPLSFGVAAADFGRSPDLVAFASHVSTLANGLAPIFFVLSVLLFLPAYRSILCCSQGYAIQRVAAEVEVKTSSSSVSPTQSLPVQNLAVPTLHHADSPYNTKVPSATPVNEDFGAILTNPPNVTYYNPTNPQEDFGAVLTNPPNVTYYSPAKAPDFGDVLTNPPNVTPYNPVQPSAQQVAALPMQQVYIPTAQVVPIEQYHVIQPAVFTQQQIVSAPVNTTTLVHIPSHSTIPAAVSQLR